MSLRAGICSLVTLVNAPKGRNLIFNVGLHRDEGTECYLKEGFCVVAFEANPELLALCVKRLRLFIDRGQLSIVHGAIVDPGALKAGQKSISFYRNESGLGWGTVHAA